MQMLASGNELTANGNRESTRMKTANGREMIRKRTKFEPQMDADLRRYRLRLGFIQKVLVADS
jgi:hypothetical protein